MNILPAYYRKALGIIRKTEKRKDTEINKIEELISLGINVHHTARSYALAFNEKENENKKEIIVPQTLHTRNLQTNDFNEFQNKTRAEYIFEKLHKDHCDPDDIAMIKQITEQFADQFYVPGDILSISDIVQHRIPIKPGLTPRFVRQFRIPEMQKEKLRKHVEEMERQGLIEKCNSPHNSPAFFVPKKDEFGGKTDERFVVDYKGVNEVTVESDYPLPLIEEIIESMNGHNYYTVCDINSAFHQIKVHPDDRDLTAFTALGIKYRWNRMPMGLSGSPRTFQAAANIMLKDRLGRGINVLMDDIIISHETKEGHDELLFWMLNKLREHNFQLKISKCVFYAREITYLGHVISRDGIRPNPDKVKCIEEFPRPKTKVKVLSFLGMINFYRKFIRGFAQIAHSLYEVIKPSKPFIWTTECEEAFNKLRRALIDEVTLKFADPKAPFFVYCDASNVAIGGVCTNGNPPNDRPIYFLSKMLNSAQRNYSTIERELVAITETIKVLKPILYLRKFLLYTDHRPLVYLFTMKKPNSRIMGQRMELMDMDFKIIYRPGAQNQVADALSRIEMSEEKDLEQILTENCTEENKVQHLCMALTRQKAAKVQDEQPERFDTSIEEEPSLATDLKFFDHIFSIIPRNQNSTINKITENKIDAIKHQPNKFADIEDGKSITLFDEQIEPDMNSENFENMVKEMYDQCTTNHWESIAINTDFKIPKNIFCLKYHLQKTFRGASISIVIYTIHQQNNRAKRRRYSKDNANLSFITIWGTLRNTTHAPNQNMTQDIKKFVNECATCEKIKTTKNTKMPLQITSTGKRAFDHVFIDFVGPINPPSEDGHKYIFTAQCDLTKFGIAVPTLDSTATTAATCFVEEIALRYGFPSIVTSDNGAAFTSELFEQVNKKLNIKNTFSTKYHPRANIVERLHRTINTFLRAYTQQKKHTWHKLLPYAMFAYNNVIQSTTGRTPFELVHGYQIELPDQIKRKKPIYSYDSYAELIRVELQSAWKIANERLHERKITNKQQYDKKLNVIDFKINDLVLVKAFTKHEKFQETWNGPYRIVDVPSEAYVVIL